MTKRVNATAAWLDEQYNNRARVPEYAAHLAHWAQESADARRQTPCVLDLAYGHKPTQTLDVFPASRSGSPVLVFIHGGYWRSLDKSDHSFLAPAWQQEGCCVVVPNYSLCPGDETSPIRISDIALEMTAVMRWLIAHASTYGGDPSRCVVVGHSAGGHLAAMLSAMDWQAWGRTQGLRLPKRWLKAAVSISGVHDLRPLVKVPFLQPSLRLTHAQAVRCSPALMPAPRGARIWVAVGAFESDEFKRQSDCLQMAWGKTVVPQVLAVSGTNHFSVVESAIKRRTALHAMIRDACATV